jgi:hypothetical protein
MKYSNDNLNYSYDKTDGYCWHCGKKLSWKNYGQVGKKVAWETSEILKKSPTK